MKTRLLAAAAFALMLASPSLAQQMSAEEFATTAASSDMFEMIDKHAAHEEALALMEGYAESGDNEALKAHAQKTAPIIERHAEHVKELGSGA